MALVARPAACRPRGGAGCCGTHHRPVRRWLPHCRVGRYDYAHRWSGLACGPSWASRVGVARVPPSWLVVPAE
eukprot:7300782-Alexandrium_andersonii.AAC.1